MSRFISIVYLVVIIYAWLIVARVVVSWFPTRFNGPLYAVKRVLHRVTEPYLGLFRRFLPLARVGTVVLDPSAFLGLIVLFIVIQLLARV